MTKGTLLPIFGVLTFLILITTGVFLYAQGYRLDFRQRTLTTTGVILAKSLPEGAQVFLDGELTAATNSPISGIKPGTHRVKIEKDGYFSWENDIEVQAQLVTEVTALLPPLSPSLIAITQEGARLVTLAPSGTKAAFLSKDKLFLLSLAGQLFGFLRTSPQEIGKETPAFPFTQAITVAFSPNEDQILVSTSEKSLLYSINQTAPQTVLDPLSLKKSWEAELLAQRKEVARALKIPEELKDIAASTAAVWSPDEEKILYIKDSPAGRQEFWVANFIDPQPVGEKTNQKVWELQKKDLRLFWLADSHHFLMVDNGTVSLLDLDGTNKRDLFTGILAQPIALSSSDLAKVIVLTSISSGGAANLYAISLR